MVRAIQLERSAEQGRDPRALSHARALWRQSRRHARRVARLFRQGAAAAVARRKPRCWSRCRNRRSCAGRIARPQPRARARDRVLDRVAAAGRVPADEVARAKPKPVAGRRGGRCRRSRRMPPIRRSRPRPTRKIHRLTIDAPLQKNARRPGARARARARAGYFGRDRRGRQCDRRSAGARRVGRLFRRAPRRAGRHDAGAALARLDAEAVHLRPRPSRTASSHPETLIEDRPVRYGSYAPENFDLTFQGTVTVRRRCSCRSTCRRSRCSTASAPAG